MAQLVNLHSFIFVHEASAHHAYTVPVAVIIAAVVVVVAAAAAANDDDDDT